VHDAEADRVGLPCVAAAVPDCLLRFSGHEQEVFVVVDGPTAADAGSFTLTAAIR
jgi:hypothetical protein